LLNDGRVEINSNIVDARSGRSPSIGRTGSSLASTETECWATIASLIEAAKLIDVEPLGYLTDVLSRIVNGILTADRRSPALSLLSGLELKAVA